jgi:hypothetical protein
MSLKGRGGWSWVVGAALDGGGYQECIVSLQALHTPY